MLAIGCYHVKWLKRTPWPNKNASIVFGIIFQKLIDENEKSFHGNNK